MPHTYTEEDGKIYEINKTEVNKAARLVDIAQRKAGIQAKLDALTAEEAALNNTTV